MTAGSRLVALTGASGFIGSWIARYLAGAGWRVRVLVRPGSQSRLPDVPLEICHGTLEDEPALVRFLAGATSIVHCAGRVRGVSAADFDPVNSEATARLARLSQAHGLSRFILISSLAAREPQLSPYAASKRKAEQYLAREGKALAWLALRPPAVYGPGDREMRPLLEALAKGIAPIVGHPGGRFSLLYVEDLAAAVLASLRSSASRMILEIDDGKPGGYSWDEIMAIAAAFRGGRIVPLPVPEWMLLGLARVSVLGARLRNRAPMLTPAKVNELRHPDWVCDNTKVVKALDWQPQVDFAQGLAKTLTT